MGFLRFISKAIGVLIIFFSIIAGVIALEFSEWEGPALFYIALYLITGVLLFLLGFFLFAGKEKFKEKFWISLRAYTGFTIVFTLFGEAQEISRSIKHQAVSHPSDIYLDSVALPGPINFIAIASMLIAAVSLTAIYIKWFKAPKFVYFIFGISLILAIAIPYLSKDDYRAIREEGIVMEIQGEHTHIPWDEIYSVRIDGYIHDGGRNPDYFRWDFLFLTLEGPVQFGPFGVSNRGLEDSLNIKKAVKSKEVNFSADWLTEDEWKLVKRQLKDKAEDATPPKPEDFYSLFEAEPISEASGF